MDASEWKLFSMGSPGFEEQHLASHARTARTSQLGKFACGGNGGVTLGGLRAI